jgi:hypothetical protein
MLNHANDDDGLNGGLREEVLGTFLVMLLMADNLMVAGVPTGGFNMREKNPTGSGGRTSCCVATRNGLSLYTRRCGSELRNHKANLPSAFYIAPPSPDTNFNVTTNRRPSLESGALRCKTTQPRDNIVSPKSHGRASTIFNCSNVSVCSSLPFTFPFPLQKACTIQNQPYHRVALITGAPRWSRRHSTATITLATASMSLPMFKGCAQVFRQQKM